jgi:hypothetical protein
MRKITHGISQAKKQTIMTTEEFNKIPLPDFLQHFLRYPDKEGLTAACLHFLGDDAQRWYDNKNSEVKLLNKCTNKNCKLCNGTGEVKMIASTVGKVHYYECYGDSWAGQSHREESLNQTI